MKLHLKKLVISSISAATLITLPSPGLPIVQAEGVALQGSQLSNAVTLPNAVLDLKFENGVADSSSSSLSTSVYGSPEFVQGRIGQAIRFQSNEQFVDLGNHDEFRFGENTDFSITFWIKTEGITGDPSIISNKDWNSGSNTGWILGVNGSGSLIWNYKTSQSNRLDSSIPNVADNKWHHIVVSHDRTNGKAQFYKDGVLVQTVDISQMKGTLDSPYTTKIGQDGTGKYGSALKAQVDDMQIYRNVLTDTNVRTLFDSAPPLKPTPVQSVSLDRTELTLNSGAPMPLNVTLSPIDATVQDVKWSSSNEKIAKVQIVDNRPTIIAGEPGEATVTIRTIDGRKTASVRVRVTNSMDLTGDGLLTNEDLQAVLKRQNSKAGDKRWEKSKIADLNNDKKVDRADVKIMEDKLKPYKKDFLYKRVVFIGIDGAGNGVKNPQAGATNINKLIKEGAVTYEAKAMLPTISAQNWGSMFHGVDPSRHGLTNDIVGTTYYPEVNDYPSFMKLLKQERPMIKQASFATWSPINKGIIEDSSGAYKVNGGNDETTTQKAVDYIKSEGLNTRSIFVHLDEVDGAGHTYGYYTDKFYEQLQKADQRVGQIVSALEQTGLMKDTLIIVTTDHGGSGTGHGGSTPEEQTVFWTAKGSSIKPGTVLGEVRNIDTAAVIAHALRLTIPENWDAKIPTGLFKNKK
ncbi:alkaline phosphatase family protein [Paenibacillus sp. Marseille-Q4541]|uniref:alkaline phosphatase family protein n=1 Tax=Paenibacillus sp. Marseille-Q4541 TaxID=2831522 RepID=UPI001BA8018D|nr:alkaline phosphatase family protein [Paenibacillus sp. Marseille-Q4541]